MIAPLRFSRDSIEITLVPNLEDYNSSMAKLIAKSSGQLIRGILWCGEDVRVYQLKWEEDQLNGRLILIWVKVNSFLC